MCQPKANQLNLAHKKRQFHRDLQKKHRRARALFELQGSHIQYVNAPPPQESHHQIAREYQSVNEPHLRANLILANFRA